MSLRAKCDNRLICGAHGHIRTATGWERCACLVKEMNKRALGTLYSDNPMASTPIGAYAEDDLLLEGVFTVVKQHVSRVVLDEQAKGRTVLATDAYRLIDIFLEKDVEHSTQRPLLEADLLVLMLGFGDPRNAYLPELLVQCLQRRKLSMKPTWVILGCDPSALTRLYSAEVERLVKQFKRITAQ